MVESFIVKGFFTEKECNDIIDFSLQNLKLNAALVGSDVLDKNIRKSSISFANYDNVFPFIKERLLIEIKNNIKVKGYEIDFENQPYQFTEYKSGEYYNWHKDTSETGMYANRYCSVVIQLNDEYSDGDLQMQKSIDDDIITFEKGRGNLFVFLSNIRHRVTEVKNGTRYSLVSWFKLKPIENFKKTLI